MFQPIRKRNFPMWSCYLQDQEKWGIFVENLTNIIPAKVGSNWLSNFRDDRNVKRLWKDAKWWQKITRFFWSAELKKKKDESVDDGSHRYNKTWKCIDRIHYSPHQLNKLTVQSKIFRKRLSSKKFKIISV